MTTHLRYTLIILGSTIIAMVGFWYLTGINLNNEIPQVSVIDTSYQTQTGKNNILSENQDETLEVATPDKPQEVKMNLTWTNRTLSGTYYQFGSGNPVEVDKTVEELIEINKACMDTGSSCDRQLSRFGEYLSGFGHDDGTWEFDRKPSRMTPEIEYLVYSFLSNPIIRQTSETCAEYFSDFQKTYAIYGSNSSDLGVAEEEFGQAKWWNPYDINIDNFILIHPTTGRKVLELNAIETLRTQIEAPSYLEGGLNFTNYPLRECLERNNQLTLLQSHVVSHQMRLREAWYGGQ